MWLGNEYQRGVTLLEVSCVNVPALPSALVQNAYAELRSEELVKQFFGDLSAPIAELPPAAYERPDDELSDAEALEESFRLSKLVSDRFVERQRKQKPSRIETMDDLAKVLFKQ